LTFLGSEWPFLMVRRLTVEEKRDLFSPFHSQSKHNNKRVTITKYSSLKQKMESFIPIKVADSEIVSYMLDLFIGLSVFSVLFLALSCLSS
jgi:hypothetical protein